MSLTPGQLRAPLFWVLHLEWAGLDWYWATDRTEITTDDGDTIVAESGLAVSWRQVAELLAVDEVQIALSVGPLTAQAFPHLDIPTMIEEGHDLTGSPCELSLWSEGTTWERRSVKLLARAAMAEYGTNAEGLSFELRPDPVDAGALDPFHRMRAYGDPEGTGDASFSFDNEQAAGMIAPFVFGRPGIAFGNAVSDGDPGTIPMRGGSPAVPQLTDPASQLRTTRMIIAQHPVTASSVELVNLTNPGKLSDLAVSAGTDPDGNVISNVTVTHSTPGALYSGYEAARADTVWCNWMNDDVTSTGGGFPSRYYAGKELRGAGELILEMLRRGQIAHDGAAWEGIRQRLDVYRFDGFINEPVGALEWLRQEVFPLLPLSVAAGPSGLFPVLWQPGQPDEAAVRHLYGTEDGGSLSRLSGPFIRDSHIANEFEIAYKPRSDEQGHAGRLILTGRELRQTTTTSNTSDLASRSLVRQSSTLRRSVTRFGLRRDETIASNFIYDDQTARKIIGWRSELLSAPWREVVYGCERADASLTAGDLVLLTDSELALSSRQAWVRAVEWRDTQPVIHLLLIPEGA